MNAQASDRAGVLLAGCVRGFGVCRDRLPSLTRNGPPLDLKQQVPSWGGAVARGLVRVLFRCDE